MLELVDKTDFWNFSNEEFECPMGNCRSRISLIKQLNKGWNTYKKLLLGNGVTPSNCCDELSCDESLVCGDINFGDDELNWIKHLNISKYFIKEVEGHIPKVLFIHKCVEAIQEIPKLEIIVESKLCSKRLLISDSLQYEKDKIKL